MYEKIRSETLISISIDIKCINFICIISRYLETLVDKLKENYKINTKNCIELFVTKILMILLYKKKTKKIIDLLFEKISIIFSVIVLLQSNRNFQRKRITPGSKWGERKALVVRST